jgi:hypothetical protein
VSPVKIIESHSMTLATLDFEEIDEADLMNLIQNGVPEGLLYEYKRADYLGNDDGTREFLKDVTAFANTHGGHLIIGMEETDRLPSRLAPLTPASVDVVIQRYENLLLSAVEPRVIGYRIRAITISGGVAIVIRVPRSWNPPHRVTHKGINRFHVRNSAGVHEPSVQEMRVLFAVGGTAQDSVRAFRQQRLAKITAGETPIPLDPGAGRLTLHIMPVSAFSVSNPADLALAKLNCALLKPLNPEGSGINRYNFEGLVNKDPSANGWRGYSQLFRNGVIEAVSCGYVGKGYHGRQYVYAHHVEKSVVEATINFATLLQKLNIPPPFVAAVTLQGGRGAHLFTSLNRTSYDDTPIAYDSLELPEAIVEEYGAPLIYHRALQGTFDALWNTVGLDRCQHYDDTGAWSLPTGP